MTSRNRSRFSVRGVSRVAWPVVVLALAGCQPSIGRLVTVGGEPGDADLPLPNPELRGKVEIDGSSTVYPISEAISSAFNRRYPGVNVVLGASGTGGGFNRFSQGEIDVSDASRPIKRDEFERCRAAGVTFLELPIAYDGLTLVVHPDNAFIDHLTLDELGQIFRADEAAKLWSEVREGWPEERILLFAPGTDSGTFDYFVEVVAGDDGTLRSDMSTSEDDNVLVTGISGSPTAIGFFGVAYFEENRDKLKAVPVVNPRTGRAVLPTSEAIEKGDYAPFSRPLFIYVNDRSVGRPEVKRFIRFYLENAGEMARSTGYVPLPPEIYEEARDRVQGRKTGTHYLTSALEPRSGPVTRIYRDENRTDSR